MVAGSPTDILQVVMLAPGPDTLLATGRPLVGKLVRPDKDIFELDHAGVGKEKGRVVLGDQGGRSNEVMAVPSEILQETVADLRTR
jgi:hypothetical protein